MVADGCIIHASKIERSVIGVRSRIGKDTTMINTYMMGSDWYESLEEMVTRNTDIVMGIGEGCHIENAIIDKNCRIGDKVIIIGGEKLEDQETDLLVVADGIVVVKKDARIPNGFVFK